MSKLTIIIPIYNAKETLSYCLDSINKQTYSNFNVLLINDGSSDNSLSIARQYEKEFPLRYEVIDKENEGVAKTRQLGIKKAKSEYIMFIDNDDFIDETYVSSFMEATEGQHDIVIGGYRRTTYDKTLYSVMAYDSPWTKYQIITPWAKAYKRQFSSIIIFLF